MAKKQYTLEVHYLDSELELHPDDAKLLQHAHAATARAYAPYSKFRVGAAVRLNNGEIISGSNQENAAYPSGLCAERVALFYANSNFPEQDIEAIAVTVRGEGNLINEPITPCGSCRQVMAEFENKAGKPMKVIMQGETGVIMMVESVNMLLPFSFLDDYLIKYSS